MAKILPVLCDDPITGYPKSYPRNDVPEIKSYSGGQSTPTPNQIDSIPGRLLGSVSGELDLRPYLTRLGHTFTATSDKDGPESVFEKELPDADIVISLPFWPAYLTAERIAKAKKLKLAITAGIGSDHVDLEAANQRGITVAEVTYSNGISVAEHVVMMILSLVRNYLPAHEWAVKGGWKIADCVERSYDLEGVHVGTVVKVCDVVTINAPLHPETENMFNEALLSKMKRGAYLVNTARAKICDRDAIVRALGSGQLAGYAGDVCFLQPAPADHPWRTMPYNGMTPHISGTSLSPQARYAAGTAKSSSAGSSSVQFARSI